MKCSVCNGDGIERCDNPDHKCPNCNGTGVIELSDSVKKLLSAAVEAWADEHLEGRPALLANAVFMRLEKELLLQQEEIEKTFPR